MHEPNKELRLPLMKNSRLMVRQIILVKFKKYSEISNILAWLRSVAWILEDNADLIEKQLFFYFIFFEIWKAHRTFWKNPPLQIDVRSCLRLSCQVWVDVRNNSDNLGVILFFLWYFHNFFLDEPKIRQGMSWQNVILTTSKIHLKNIFICL